MHIANLVSDDDRPENIRKPSEPDLDLNDWETADKQPQAVAPDYSVAIALAASDAAMALGKEQRRQQHHEAKALAEKGFKEVADQIKEATGVSIGYDTPWAYDAKPKVAYGLWKRVIPLFIENPEFLDIGPTALAKKLNASEMAYTINRDMIYDKLNSKSVADLRRMLKKMHITMTLENPVTIRSVQKQLIERRDAAKEIISEEFIGRFRIRGDVAYVNGKSYKIQFGKTGKPRIKSKGEWLALDALRIFCSAT